MFQNIISSSPWIWTGLFASMVVLPILIHLINRLRHKTVRWAAMDFLLTSHRKNRNWIWLRQLLLLLARIGVLLLVLLMVGQIGCDNDNLTPFSGSRTTHHYIIVDDSLSMSDSDGNLSALDCASKAMEMIASRIRGKNNHRVTVIRYSHTRPTTADSGVSNSEKKRATDDEFLMAELNAQVANREIDKTIRDIAAGLQATSLSIQPQAALDVVGDLVQQRTGENAVVYLLSDFREQDWSPQGVSGDRFARLSQAGAKLELIRCSKRAHNNMAITSLEADGSVRVAGIPLMMEVQVKNFGQETIRKVQIELISATYPTTGSDDLAAEWVEPELDELPAILIDEIAAGETISRRFPVFFSLPGQHAVRASLQDDSLAGDNSGWVVTTFTNSEKVLVVDGPDSHDGQLVSLAISPGGMTGLHVELAGKSILRDADDEKLDQYETIFLLDIDRLDDAAAGNLRAFAERGGGVVFFAGPNTNLKHYTTHLYANGEGIYPIPLDRTLLIPEQLEEQTADIAATRHPVFGSLPDVDHSPLDLVQIHRTCQPPPEWSHRTDNSVDLVGTVRGQERVPLIVEKRIGKGTVLAVLTTAGPQWNNWLRNPTYPATLLLIQDYVSRGRNNQQRQLAGSSRGYSLASREYQSEVTFVSPANDGFDRSAWTENAEFESAGDENRKVTLGKSLDETSRPGIYETWLTDIRGSRELERFALNIDVSESELELASRADLLDTLDGIPARIVDWDRFGPAVGNNRGTSMVRLMLFLLLTGLVAEQLLACWNSFHPRTPQRSSNRFFGSKGRSGVDTQRAA